MGNMNEMNNMNMNNMNMNNMNMNNMNNMNINNMNMNNMNMNNMNMNNNFNQMFGNMNTMQNQILNNFQNNFNNQMEMVNNQMESGNNNQPSNAFLTVFFRDGKLGTNNRVIEDIEGPRLAILCKNDEKVSEIIERYRTKSNFHEEARFIFNAKNLNVDLTVAESGIQNNSNIFVISLKGIKGAYYLNIFDSH